LNTANAGSDGVVICEEVKSAADAALGNPSSRTVTTADENARRAKAQLKHGGRVEVK
jgi:hypothetical protein